MRREKQRQSDIDNQKVKAFSGKQAYGQNKTQCQSYRSYLTIFS